MFAISSRKGAAQWRRLAILCAVTALLAVMLPLSAVKAAGPISSMPKQGMYNAGSNFYQSGVCAADINADGKDELLIGNANGTLYCFNANAGLIWYCATGSRIDGTPAAYDVNNDGKMEIFFGNRAGMMYGLDCNGRQLSEYGWPKQTPASADGGIWSSPAIGDINGDGVADIVVGTWQRYIWAWSYTGGVLPGWPYDNQDSTWSSPALADIDHDGVKEVIIGSDVTGGPGWYPRGGIVYAFNGDTSKVAGWPRSTPEVIWSSPAAADINGDGHYEIIVGTGHYWTAVGSLNTEAFRVYAFTENGDQVAGWPVVTRGCTFSSPQLGDIDGDGRREICIGCNGAGGKGQEGIMAIRPNGTFLWDIAPFGGAGGPMMGSPAIADVDGDGKPDVISGSSQQMVAWNYRGEMVWNEPMGETIVTNPAAGDFDRDGKIEVAFGTGFTSQEGGKFWVCETNGRVKSQTNDPAAPWKMFRFDSKHNATLLMGNEPPPPPPPPPPANFYEYILLANPNSRDAKVTVQFTNEQAQKKNVTLTVKKRSRTTVNVNEQMPNSPVSTKVTSDVPIVAERSLYFNYQSQWTGGSDAVGAVSPGKRWYFAEGTTQFGFDEYITVQNPGTVAANLTFRYMIEGMGEVDYHEAVAANSRATYNVASRHIGSGKNASLLLQSDQNIVAERPMYFNYQGKWTGGHVVVGAQAPSTNWYLSEGTTRTGFDEWLCLQNPNAYDIVVNATYMLGSGQGGPVARSYRVPARQRLTVSVNYELGPDKDASVKLTSKDGFIAERPMYFDYQGKWTGGHDVLGTVTPAANWFLAEGYTGQDFEEWLCLQNPGAKDAVVSINYLLTNGSTIVRSHLVPANSRVTINVNNEAGGNLELSAQVSVTNGQKVIVERPMYFNYQSRWSGGHDGVGVANASTTWYFAEGYTGQ